MIIFLIVMPFIVVDRLHLNVVNYVQNYKQSFSEDCVHCYENLSSMQHASVASYC
jgi:hypothetical protein